MILSLLTVLMILCSENKMILFFSGHFWRTPNIDNKNILVLSNK